MHNGSLWSFVFPLHLADLRIDEAVPGSKAAAQFLSKCGWLSLNKAGNGEE